MNTTETKKKTIKDYDATGESPYVVELQSKYIQPDAEHKTMQGDDGKMYGMYEIPKGKTRAIDTASYCKLFKGNTPRLMSLSEPAMRMYHYLVEYMPVNRDEICILQEDYLAYAGYQAKSRLTYYRAIEGLLKAEIIARKTGGGVCYWVNPNILFNGDRTKLKNIKVQGPDKAFSGFSKSDDI